MNGAVAFEVAVDPDRIEGARYRNVTGPLAVRLGSVWFPERSWSDFPVIVLGWWIGEAGQVLRGSEGDFVFMDGPYRFSVYPARTTLRVVLEDLHSDPAAVVAEAHVSPESFQSAIRRAAQLMVEACDARGWVSCDLDSLRSGLGS